MKGPSFFDERRHKNAASIDIAIDMINGLQVPASDDEIHAQITSIVNMMQQLKLRINIRSS